MKIVIPSLRILPALRILVFLSSLPIVLVTQAQPEAGASAPSFAQVQETELARLREGARTQTTIEQLDDERLELLGEYRIALRQNRDLRKYNQQLGDIIQSQQEEMASLRNQIDRVGTLERDIVPLMLDMLDALENFVTLDLPFFVEERRLRIANLRRLMGDGNVANSEKYRRILEAYQIENDYGRVIETEQAPLIHSATPQQVNYLKVGRLTLFYQTLDGRRSYRWDETSSSWELLDSRYNHAVGQGIKMANEQTSNDLLILPLQMPIEF